MRKLKIEMRRLDHARNLHQPQRVYLVGVKQDQIVIYEQLGPDAEELVGIFGRFSPFSPEDLRAGIQERLDRSAQFIPIIRFILVEQGKREFIAERWCFRGSIDDWIYAGHSGKINVLARKVIPALGTDDFYELY
jgi:hypothetical protein